MGKCIIWIYYGLTAFFVVLWYVAYPALLRSWNLFSWPTDTHSLWYPYCVCLKPTAHHGTAVWYIHYEAIQSSRMEKEIELFCYRNLYIVCASLQKTENRDANRCLWQRQSFVLILPKILLFAIYKPSPHAARFPSCPLVFGKNIENGFIDVRTNRQGFAV